MHFLTEMIKLGFQVLSTWKTTGLFDVIFLAGGTHRNQILQDIVRKTFSKAKIIMDNQVEIITATGAAIHGLQVLNNETMPFSVYERFKTTVNQSSCTNDHYKSPACYSGFSKKK